MTINTKKISNKIKKLNLFLALTTALLIIPLGCKKEDSSPSSTSNTHSSESQKNINYSHSTPININGPWSASWNKPNIIGTARNGQINIRGKLDDAESFTWAVHQALPQGPKRLVLTVNKSDGFDGWGGRCMFLLSINGQKIKPNNRSAQNDYYIFKGPGELVFDLPENINSLDTLTIQTFSSGSSTMNLIIDDIKILSQGTQVASSSTQLISPTVNQLGLVANNNNQILISFDGNLTNPSIYYKLTDSSGTTIQQGNSDEFKLIPMSGHLVYSFNTSKLNRPGTYFFEVKNGEQVVKSEIRVYNSLKEIYQKATIDSLQAYYYLTSGEAGPFNSHPQDKKTIDFVTRKERDVYGGLHDAGDYGKYVVNGAWTIGMLQLHSEYFPSIKNITSSNVSVDSLARIELDWMLKMQDPNGGVRHKAASANWPADEVLPNQDTFTKYVMPVSTTATASFAASMAKGYLQFKSSDPTRANRYLEASKKAWGFLESHPNLIMTQRTYEGKEYGGPYTDSKDSDERLWAAVELFKATGESKYHQYIKNHLPQLLDKLFVGDETGPQGVPDWQNVNYMAVFSYYQSEHANSQLKTKIQRWMNRYADEVIKLQNQNPYGIAIAGKNGEFNWGSNGIITTVATEMMWIYQVTGNSEHKKSAQKMLAYIFGNNPLNKSFVTGYGQNPPRHPHFRLSMGGGTLPTGLLVGGPNSVETGGDVPLTSVWNRPRALRYKDHHRSWASNEIAINWNASLFTSLSALISE